VEVHDEGKRRAIKESLVVLAIDDDYKRERERERERECARARVLVLAVAWLRAAGGEEERNWRR